MSDLGQLAALGQLESIHVPQHACHITPWRDNTASEPDFSGYASAVSALNTLPVVRTIDVRARASSA